jgi:hypothetical protein
MRVFQRGIGHIITERPFQGGPGARLYVAAGDASDILYRPPRAFDSRHLPLSPILTRDLAVATCESPDAELVYELPAELLDTQIACQVRTYADDYENETIYRPWQTETDGDGNETGTIDGTVVIQSIQKRDDGGLLVEFIYTASRYGLQPDQFALVQTSGPGSLADAVVSASVEQVQSIEISGLTDGEDYGWRLEARNGAVTANLGTVEFTADAEGPDGSVNLTITAH